MRKKKNPVAEMKSDYERAGMVVTKWRGSMAREEQTTGEDYDGPWWPRSRASASL